MKVSLSLSLSLFLCHRSSSQLVVFSAAAATAAENKSITHITTLERSIPGVCSNDRRRRRLSPTQSHSVAAA